MGNYPSDKLEKVEDAIWFAIDSINEMSGINVDLSNIEHSELLIRVREEILDVLKEWKDFENHS